MADPHRAAHARIGELAHAPAFALDVELAAAVVLAVVDGVFAGSHGSLGLLGFGAPQA
jgi:hypothetical protein